tara:strand:- start:1934 stop:2545 length:612 start_codon:yes stop_codon:yes gene_type:complete
MDSNTGFYTKDSYRQAIREERMEAFRKAQERSMQNREENMVVINSFMTWSVPELRQACAKYHISTNATGGKPDARFRVKRANKKELADRLQWAMEGRLPEEFQKRGNKRSAKDAKWANTGGMPGFQWRALSPAQRQVILSQRRMARATERMVAHQKIADEEEKEEWVEVGKAVQPRLTLEEVAEMLDDKDAEDLQAVFDLLEK